MHRASQFISNIALVVLVGLTLIEAYELFYAEQEEYYLAQAQEYITPREYLRIRAEENDLNHKLLEKIVYCESRWKMVQNKQSTAFGYFQILDGTEKETPQYKSGLRKHDPYANIDMGIYLFNRYGWRPWTESRPCWYWYDRV